MCRASYEDCSSENQIDTQADYMRAMNDQFSNALSEKIVAFVRAQREKKEEEPVQARLKSFFKADMKKRLGLQVEDPVPAEEQPAPVEETPAEEKPAEETPAEEKPAEETPAEEKPAEETPAEEKPAEEKPAEETPAEEKPAEEKPAEETPAEEKPAEEEVKPDIEGEQKAVEEDPDKIDEQIDPSDDGVSGWVWFLVFLGTLLVGAAGFFVVKKVFFKNDTDYAAANAVTA